MCFRPIVILLLSVLLLHGASYAVDTLKVTARLDTLKKRITGTVEYRLPPIPKLTSFEFQLYPNLYSSEDSPYLEKNYKLLNHLRRANSWGGMDIDSVLLDDKNVTRFMQIDFTKAVLSVGENSSLNGKTIKLFFKTYIPEMGDRLMYSGGEYMLGSWFPYPALLRENGTWYNPEYGAFAEPVGEYFNYEICLNLPDNFMVAAPVTPIESPGDDTLINLNYSFGPAHDFVLALSPNYQIDSTVFGSTKVRIFYRAYEKPMIKRIKTAVQYSLEYMTKNVGEYYYDDITVAFINTTVVGGIEFPGLIALSSPHGGLLVTRFYESLVVHETVHQWFYGMIASDQVESPWMDESITNYFTHKILLHYWDSTANLFEFAGLEFAERDNLRALSQTISGIYTIDCPTYAFGNETDYFSTIYSKGSLALETFDNIMGDSLSNIFWRQYYDRYRFKHPTPSDFYRLTGEIAGDDVRDALEILLGDAEDIDYAVYDLSNRKIDSINFEVNFTLMKKGDLNLRIDYRIILYNGDTLEKTWTPTRHTAAMSIRTISPVRSVVIDPQNIYAVDIDLLNNSISSETDSKPGIRLTSAMMFLLESLLSFLGGM